MNNTIEKALLKLEGQANELESNKIEGEVTDITILNQCKLMSNDNLHVHFAWMPHVNGINIRVYIKDTKQHVYYQVFYFDDNGNVKSLAEILQDLISIEYEYEQKESSKVES